MCRYLTKEMVMPTETETYLERMTLKIRGLQEEIRKAKIAANAIAEMDGLPVPYQQLDEEDASVLTSFQSDQFYGQPLAKCVRLILEARRAMNSGPASVTEIHDALVKGGYLFDTKDETNSKNSLRVSLGKNPLFHKLPNGGWGLLTWYPKARPPKENGAAEEDGPSTKPTKIETPIPENGLDRQVAQAEPAPPHRPMPLPHRTVPPIPTRLKVGDRTVDDGPAKIEMDPT
jgi:hypothetical protein